MSADLHSFKEFSSTARFIFLSFFLASGFGLCLVRGFLKPGEKNGLKLWFQVSLALTRHWFYHGIFVFLQSKTMDSGVPGAHSTLVLPRNIRVPAVYETMDSGVPGAHSALFLPRNIRVPAV